MSAPVAETPERAALLSAYFLAHITIPDVLARLERAWLDLPAGSVEELSHMHAVIAAHATLTEALG